MTADSNPGANHAATLTTPRRGARVLVTGAAGGLGRRLIDLLVACGCRTAGVDMVDAPDTRADLHLQADITDPGAAAAAVNEAVETLGGLDSVIGAAGIVDTIHRAATFPAADFRRDVESNLMSQVFISQAAYPALRESNTASILFVSSVAAQDGLRGQLSYSASKAAVLGLTKSLATEWSDDGIRVNAIAPGLIATPKVVAMPESARTRLLSTVPLGRVATLDEVCGCMLFLLSPAAGYITGQILRIDGGQSLNRAGLYK
ncbi:3-oxoacyl-[acyl-carrier protein] reductase [Nocardia tenerifensis]|uniref:3-oxoacyl-[acyl-carrier protein] reductase n=1 Tax=Nocardia tenerifensis TaxID=228006 RepID=A0A318JTA3_9NOCA|nr:SDR family oxidoreductase [Nocardia tenerifensis]PXX58434.1 3-oxoacyl-[acyl-carrier protein] reductase [Nocardia tenerifensis]